MRKLTVLLAVLLLTAAAAWSKMPNLTGTWKVNIEKSTFAGPPPESSVYEIRDSAEGFFIKMIDKRDGRENVVESKFDRGGKETVNRVGPMEVRTVLKDEGDVIREQSVFTSDSGKMERKSTLSLSRDGRTMTLESSFSSERGDFGMKLVLEKQ